MKMPRIICAAISVCLAAGAFSATAQPLGTVTSAPVYAPDYTHAGEPLPGGILAWDAIQKTVEATNGQDAVHFVFAFTNVAMQVNLGLATNRVSVTNYTVVTNTGFWQIISGHKFSDVPSVTLHTNVVSVTNSIIPMIVSILDVHPSCGCTTVELPPRPWTLPPGTNSSIRVTVNIAGKTGMVPKTIGVTTDKGKMDLMMHTNILPAPPAQPMSEAERAHGVAAAKVDRQAVFKGDCASCHVKNVAGKYGQQVFALVCAICHEASPRATMVPDLHQLKETTSEEFWRAWITSGKAGTLMPAFATSQGGPLSDFQIASLAAYLNTAIPPHAPAAPAK